MRRWVVTKTVGTWADELILLMRDSATEAGLRAKRRRTGKNWQLRSAPTVAKQPPQRLLGGAAARPECAA